MSFRPKIASKPQRYGMPNKIDKRFVVGLNGVGADGEYYGPPQQGESFATYEAFMSMPIASASGAAIGALIAGPIGALAGGTIGWFMSGSRTRNKPKVQGG